jgi:arylsulfatase A-like enzyme
MPGCWILKNLLPLRDFAGVKWIQAQSRDARGINQSFLDWLHRQRDPARPFFAFLNYLDAHEPFVPPEDGVHLGLRPQSTADYKMLLEYWNRDKLKLSKRDVQLTRDAYDDCITALDREIGVLLGELEKRGILKETHVIITSDHGEEFGEHGVFNHGFSLYMQEIHVPLVIISPNGPSNRTWAQPISLRDIPATVVNLLGMAGSSKFPGRPLTESAIESTRSSHALSEVDIPLVIGPERGSGPTQRGFVVSLVDEGLHYLLATNLTEELYDIAADPGELHNLKNDPRRKPALGRFRGKVLGILASNRSTGTARDYQEQLKRVIELLPP